MLSSHTIDGIKVEGTIEVGGIVVGRIVVGDWVVGIIVVGTCVVGITVVGAIVVGGDVEGGIVVGITVVGGIVVGIWVVGTAVVGAIVVGRTVIGGKVVGGVVVGVGTNVVSDSCTSIFIFHSNHSLDIDTDSRFSNDSGRFTLLTLGISNYQIQISSTIQFDRSIVLKTRSNRWNNRKTR